MIYRTECLEIKHICDKYGYGNIMEWASALWRLEAEKRIPEGWLFCSNCPVFIKDEFKDPAQQALYDKLVRDALGQKED